MILNTPVIFNGFGDLSRNEEAVGRMIGGALKFVVPGASPVSLINDALNTDKRHELRDIQKKLFLTGAKSAAAAPLAVMLAEKGSPFLALYFGVHALAIIPAIAAFLFVHAKAQN